MAADGFKFDDGKVKAAATEIAGGHCSQLQTYFDSFDSLQTQSSLLDQVKVAHDAIRKESSTFLEPLTIDKGANEGGSFSNPSVYLRIRNQHKDVFQAKYDVTQNKMASDCLLDRK